MYIYFYGSPAGGGVWLVAIPRQKILEADGVREKEGDEVADKNGYVHDHFLLPMHNLGKRVDE